jgi:hypothetical protein
MTGPRPLAPAVPVRTAGLLALHAAAWLRLLLFAFVLVVTTPGLGLDRSLFTLPRDRLGGSARHAAVVTATSVTGLNGTVRMEIE